MKKLYVSKNSIKKSILYFSTLNVNKPEQLGLFLFLKSLGFDSINYKSFPKSSSLSENEKKSYLLNLYKLAGVFDNNSEEPGKRTCLFPFSIKSTINRNDFYNGGSTFSSLLSRFRDTIDNTLVDKYLKRNDSNPDQFKFKRNYLTFLKQNYLLNNRISLNHFAVWYFRFKEIECPDEWATNTNYYKEFTRVCIKLLKEELNLTEVETTTLFINDNNLIEYSQSKITGDEFRNLFTFSSNSNPEIYKGGNNIMATDIAININTTLKLSEASGSNPSEKEILDILLKSKQVILYGPPGTGKSYVTDKIKKHFKVSKKIQFHPNTSYEQFIGGYTVDTDGKIISKSGSFLSFCEDAKSSSDNHLFIIDEINRGNISKIFGETILALDRSYEVDLTQSAKYKNKEITRFKIPENVYIIATMNSSDRSIALIDYAIRRRFAFIKFFPNYELIDSISDCTNLENINIKVLFKEINSRIFNVLKSEDLLLGHSYFMPNWAIINGKIEWNIDILKTLFNYYLIPILEEFTYGNIKYLEDIIGNELISRITDDDKFIKAIKKAFPTCVNEG